MAFIQQTELIIGQNNGKGILISDLNISFDITRSYKIVTNTAKFSIYNPSDSTTEMITQKNNNIIFKAGYTDEGIGIIFSGLIYDSTIKKTYLEKIVELTAFDFGNNQTNLLQKTVSLSYKENTLLYIIVNDIAGILNVVVTGIENIITVNAGNLKIFVGTVYNVIKTIQNILLTNGIGMYFDTNEMVFYKLNNKDSRFGIVHISAKSGLLGSPEKIVKNDKDKTNVNYTDINKYSLNVLMNSKIKPNTLINLDSKNVKGQYIVEQVQITGNNFGGEFIMKLEVTE